MLINTQIREAVAGIIRASQPELVITVDSYPSGFDATRELPAAAVLFEDGAADDEYIDLNTQSAELHIGLYVKTDNSDADLDALAEPIRLALQHKDLPIATLTYSGFAYDRDPDSPWRILRLIYNCQYILEDA